MKGLNENIPTGGGWIMELPERRGVPSAHPLARWRAVEDAVLALEPGVIREQLLDVLITNYDIAVKETS